jgi:predicted Zn finger-like uncharacterized protein
MTQAIECPNCRALFAWDEGLAGKQVECLYCKTTIRVPAGTNSPTSLVRFSNPVAPPAAESGLYGALDDVLRESTQLPAAPGRSLAAG